MQKSVLTIAALAPISTSGAALARRHDDDRGYGPPRGAVREG
jgi:hypothetical protein